MAVAYPRAWFGPKSDEVKLLEQIVELLTPPPPPETLIERRTRLERQMGAFGLKPSDYDHRELVEMGYHERHIPSWKRNK
jgi:hypothetical protein